MPVFIGWRVESSSQRRHVTYETLDIVSWEMGDSGEGGGGISHAAPSLPVYQKEFICNHCPRSQEVALSLHQCRGWRGQ